jgi:hypothetical protein
MEKARENPMSCRNSISAGADYGADWNYGGQSGWRMTEKEGCSPWSDAGPLNETGRQALLVYFGLQAEAHSLPLSEITMLSPDLLEAMARDGLNIPDAAVIAASQADPSAQHA